MGTKSIMGCGLGDGKYEGEENGGGVEWK